MGPDAIAALLSYDHSNSIPNQKDKYLQSTKLVFKHGRQTEINNRPTKKEIMDKRMKQMIKASN